MATTMEIYREWKNEPGFKAWWVRSGIETLLHQKWTKRKLMTVEEQLWLSKAFAVSAEIGQRPVEELQSRLIELIESAPESARGRRLYPGEQLFSSFDEGWEVAAARVRKG